MAGNDEPPPKFLHSCVRGGSNFIQLDIFYLFVLTFAVAVAVVLFFFFVSVFVCIIVSFVVAPFLYLTLTYAAPCQSRYNQFTNCACICLATEGTRSLITPI